MSTSFTRRGGLAAIVGGALWAITPLREPLLGGSFPGYLAVLLAMGLLALHARYKGSYGRLGTAGVFVIFGGYALMFLGSIPAVVFTEEGPLTLIRTGQDLGFLGALVALVGAFLLGLALWRSRAASRLGALLLIVSLPVGLLGVILLSAIGFEDAAGLPWTVLYGGHGSYSVACYGRRGASQQSSSPRVRCELNFREHSLSASG
ncbi:MAG: DUF973 family protein [Actinomycetota bacterium]|nr:DUF973 family protein [Actinomycetota bacterium]